MSKRADFYLDNASLETIPLRVKPVLAV